jgi:hypothetical protein
MGGARTGEFPVPFAWGRPEGQEDQEDGKSCASFLAMCATGRPGRARRRRSDMQSGGGILP